MKSTMGAGFRLKGPLLVITALLASCHGGSSTTPAPVATPGFSLSVATNGLRIPAGGAGFVVVTVSRLNGFQEAVDLSLTGAPAGVNAQGRIEREAGSFTLPLTVAAEVGEQTLNQAQIKGTSGSLTQTVGFPIQVLAPLPPTSFSPHSLAAPGAAQAGTGARNQVVALEGVQATPSAQGTTTNRSGFHPSGNPIR